MDYYVMLVECKHAHFTFLDKMSRLKALSRHLSTAFQSAFYSSLLNKINSIACSHADNVGHITCAQIVFLAKYDAAFTPFSHTPNRLGISKVRCKVGMCTNA